jgi:hypothetical protein
MDQDEQERAFNALLDSLATADDVLTPEKERAIDEFIRGLPTADDVIKRCKA